MTELPKPTIIRDPVTGQFLYRLGGTFPRVSQARDKKLGVFLAAHIPSLKQRATRTGVELKEAHVRDDVIESIVHETMHETVRAEGIWDELVVRFGDPFTASQAEEVLVDRLTQEVLEDVREEPRLKSVGGGG